MRPLTGPSGILASRVSVAGWARRAGAPGIAAATTVRRTTPGRISGLLAVGLEAARYRVPADGLHEGVDVFRGGRAVIHGVGVLVHVERQDRPAVGERHRMVGRPGVDQPLVARRP